MLNNIFILAASLYFVIMAAELATKYATGLAKHFRLSKHTVGVLVVAVISILPETFISVTSALHGESEVGLGMLFGANIADLTLIMGLIVLLAGATSLKVNKKILKENKIYPLFMLLPVIFGLDGVYTRFDGLSLVVAGAIFYYLTFKNNVVDQPAENELPIQSGRAKNALALLSSMALLLVAANYVVSSSVGLAEQLEISPILISMVLIAVGTTVPEFIFSYKAVKKNEDALALGDLLGTVLANATIVTGILVLINPFTVNKAIIYVSGTFMVVAAFLLFKFMHSNRNVSRNEAVWLILFWVCFVFVQFVTQEFIIN